MQLHYLLVVIVVSDVTVTS